MRRKRQLGLLIEPPPPDEDQTAWLVTFSDLVLQLFAFVLVSVVLGGAALPPPSTASSPTPPAPLVAEERRVPDEPTPPPCATPPPAAEVAEVAEAEEAPAPTAATARLNALGDSLRDFVKAEGREDAVSVTVRDSDLIVTLSDTISFPSGSADLLPTAAPILHRISALAGTLPDLDIEVGGHTDDVPIHTGSFPSNLELSLARAARVVHELAAGDARLAERAIAAGFGEHRPVASNTDEAGRARNRRVDIRLMPRLARPPAVASAGPPAGG
jgi:chemotaxis protein MotB